MQLNECKFVYEIDTHFFDGKPFIGEIIWKFAQENAPKIVGVQQPLPLYNFTLNLTWELFYK